jgi:hypothetical protein
LDVRVLAGSAHANFVPFVPSHERRAAEVRAPHSGINTATTTTVNIEFVRIEVASVLATRS